MLMMMIIEIMNKMIMIMIIGDRSMVRTNDD